jgi:hypothetical protein
MHGLWSPYLGPPPSTPRYSIWERGGQRWLWVRKNAPWSIALQILIAASLYRPTAVKESKLCPTKKKVGEFSSSSFCDVSHMLPAATSMLPLRLTMVQVVRRSVLQVSRKFIWWLMQWHACTRVLVCAAGPWRPDRVVLCVSIVQMHWKFSVYWFAFSDGRSTKRAFLSLLVWHCGLARCSCYCSTLMTLTIINTHKTCWAFFFLSNRN